MWASPDQFRVIAVPRRLKSTSGVLNLPNGLLWRSSTGYIITTVTIGIFADIFLHSIIVPILPFVLHDRLEVPQDDVQEAVDNLLSAYAIASVLLSPFAGVIADRATSRQAPYVLGLTALILSTLMWYMGRSILVLTVARFAQGASCAFVYSVGLAMCIDTVGPDKLGKTVGTMFSFISLGGICAPIVGGVAYEKVGYGAVSAISVSVLVIDLSMRILVIEKKTAADYMRSQGPMNDAEDRENSARGTSQDTSSDESGPLLSLRTASTDEFNDNNTYLIPEKCSKITRSIPLLYCLTDSASLVLAQIVAFSQAILLSAFNATVPTYAAEHFGFGPFKASLLFIPLGVLNLIIGPVGGWAADHYGTKFVGVLGFSLLTPALALLRLPEASTDLPQVTTYIAVLALCGLGLPLLGTASVVEAGLVVGRYHKRNPAVFTKLGPYAQLYSLNHTVFSLGLAVGPFLAGGLKDRIGYGNMNATLASSSALTALLCYLWLGGKPKK